MEIEHFSMGDRIGFMRGEEAIVFNPKTKVVASYRGCSFVASPHNLSYDLSGMGTNPEEIMEAVDKWYTSRT